MAFQHPTTELQNGTTQRNGKATIAEDNVAVEADEHHRRMSAPEKKRSPSVVSRGGWANRWEFLLSCVGLSVGIGNVWRFPYLAYENGGGAFLIPYLLMLLLAGKPLYFMELAFGQFAGVGPVAIWTCLPIAKGVGWAMVCVSFIVVIYYCVIMAYTLFYMFSTFQSVVPWSYCDPSWASGTSCVNRSEMINGTNGTAASQAYWDYYVLNRSESIADPGGIKWDLALCLLLAWIIVIVCLLKGIKTSGKVVYFAATFPYVILLTLLVTGLLQPGAMEGVMYFINPQFDKLLNAEVWQKAAGQMFFSLSISMGALIMYSSYNDFRHNIFRDAMVVSILDTLTSIIAGLVIFSILGAMARETGQDISKVAASGPGLAFVAYPEALTRLPCPQAWSFFFFLMLFILGLDSEFALLENVITSAIDEFPWLRKRRTWFCIALASFCYLIGLSCTSRGGYYVLGLMDNYGGNTGLLFVAVVEIIALSWLYGMKEFCYDIEFMLSRRIGWYWKLTWAFTAPLVLMFVFVYWLANLKLMSSEKEFEPWADAVGWGLAGFIIIQVPLWAIIMVARQPAKTLKEKIASALMPSLEWRPSQPELTEEWLQFKADKRAGGQRLRATSLTKPQLRKITPISSDFVPDKKFAFDNLTFEHTNP